MVRFVLLLSVVSLSFSVMPSNAAPTVVRSMNDLREAIKRTEPGSVIVVADGTYELQSDLELKRLKGTPESPVTIQAESVLGVVITGDHIVKVRDSTHFVLQGFRFRMRSDVHGKGGAVSVRNCEYGVIRQNAFELDETGTGQKNQTWLTLDGEISGHHQVLWNRFANKSRPGHFIFVTGEGDYVSQHDRIEGNHFVDLAYGNDENGFETIRVGESRIGNVGGKSHTAIRGNLFERCQGEDEIISFKVGGCDFSGNTVRDCHGSVVFRDGDDGVFASNVVLNTYDAKPFDAYRSGGVRFYGARHRIFNNHFEGLDGTSMKAPLAMMHGAPAGSGALGVADGLPSTDCVVVHNTWVRCAQLRLGMSSEKRPLPPSGCTFANNVVYETTDDRLLRIYGAAGVSFRGNLLHTSNSKKTGVDDLPAGKRGFEVIDPELRREDGIYRLRSDSPAVNAAKTRYDFVKADLDGDARDLLPDIGADEYNASTSRPRRPLKAADVGPQSINAVP